MEKSLVKSVAELGFTLKNFSVFRSLLMEYFLSLSGICQTVSNLFWNEIGNLKLHIIIKFNKI